MFIPSKDQDLNVDDNDQSDAPFTRENWDAWIGSSFQAGYLEYFNRIASSEYLSQDFFKFPAYLRREIAHSTLQKMPIESMEAYVKLRQTMPRNNQPTYSISDDYFKKIRRDAASNSIGESAESYLSEITLFARSQDNKGDQNTFAYNKIVAIALVEQYGARLMTVAMREWRIKSTRTEIHLFVNFVKTLAESDHPPEWTAAVIL